MANIVTEFNPTGKVQKFTLKQHTDFPELMRTTYIIECWGAKGGSDEDAYANGDYSSANKTYVAGKNGDYTKCYIDIIEDVDVYVSVGTAGSLYTGGFYGGRGNLRSGGSSSVSFIGTDGSSATDTTNGRMIISAKGGDSGTRLTHTTSEKQVVTSRMSDCPDRLRCTLWNSYWKYRILGNGDKKGYVEWDASKKKTEDVNDERKYTLTMENVKSKRAHQEQTSFWVPIALFSFKYDTNFTFTWECRGDSINDSISFRISCPYMSRSEVRTFGEGSSGSLSWEGKEDVTYSIDMYVTEEPVTFFATFYPTNHDAYYSGHNHVFVGIKCDDTTKSEITEVNWSMENPNTCSVANSFLSSIVFSDNYHGLTYDTSVIAEATTSPNGNNGFVRITRLDPRYMPNNVKNDDYRRLLVHRPIVGREQVDEVFERELYGVRKDRLIKDYEYNINITQGYTEDNFEQILARLTEVLNNGSWSLLRYEEDVIFDQPGAYEYVFPSPGIYMFECWGASGGDDPQPEYDEDNGYYDPEDLENNEEEPEQQPHYELAGRGGYARGICYVNENVDKVCVYVGGQGTMTSEEVTTAQGGFNGGGTVNRLIIEDNNSDNYERQFHYVDIGSGGGASDIRLNTSLYSRVIVAGGGAGKGLEELRGDAGGVSSNYITKYLSITNIRTLLLPATADIRNDSNININNFNSYELDILSNWNKINCSNCNGDGYVTIAKQSDKEGDVYNYSYTGNYQSRTLSPGKYKLEVWGAQGGYNGGYGGYSVGIITLTETTTFYIYVGGAGGSWSTKGTGGAGWNGGGSASSSGSSTVGGGGGATDIRRGGTSLNNRIIVAGGGGGHGNGYSGGSGGGTTGGNGSGDSGGSTYKWDRRGYGGTQSSGGAGGFCGASITSASYDYYSDDGSFGKGGDGYTGTSGSAWLNTAGGGGGWYGGGGGGNNNKTSGGTARGGGGGSGYIGGVQNGSMSNGIQSGNGYAKITVIESAIVYEQQTCAQCNGTKWHYDPDMLDNTVDQILDSKKNISLTFREHDDKYTAIVPQDVSSCIATDTAAGRDSSFGTGNTLSYTYYVADKLNNTVIQSYITPMTQNVRSGDAAFSNKLGTWAKNLLDSKYKINCTGRCGGNGTYQSYEVVSTTYMVTVSGCSTSSHNGTFVAGQEKCNIEKNKTYWLRDNYNYVTHTCPTCNGTAWHYNPNRIDEMITDINANTAKLNSDDSNIPSFTVTDVLINRRTVTTKACGCGGGWYAGGTNRVNHEVTRSGGGSSYVYKNNTAYPSNTNKPNKDWYCVNDEIISGTSLIPTPYSDPDHLDYERGHLGNGAVRIRRIVSIGANILPQEINITHDIHERRIENI